MKEHAQSILLFTAHPLEPIVALQLQKSYQSQNTNGFNHNDAMPTLAELPTLFLYLTDATDNRMLLH